MKVQGELLLDTHHSHHAARRLPEAGHDADAAADDIVLAAVDDKALLQAAAVDERTVVAENVKDFDRTVRSWSSTGEHHAGVIFPPP